MLLARDAASAPSGVSVTDREGTPADDDWQTRARLGIATDRARYARESRGVVHPAARSMRGLASPPAAVDTIRPALSGGTFYTFSFSFHLYSSPVATSTSPEGLASAGASSHFPAGNYPCFAGARAPARPPDWRLPYRPRPSATAAAPARAAPGSS